MSKWYNVFQPIYQVDKDLNVTISHYEMLLRDENDSFPNNDFFRVIGTEEENQKWILAEKESIDQAFAKYPDICINLNIEPIQFAYPSVWEFIENIYSKYGKKVVIEVTERQLQAGTLGNKQFDKSFQRFHDIGLDVVLDDVDSGGHSLTFVDHHSDIISGIKLSLLDFDPISPDTTIKFINAWASFAKEKHLDLVVEAMYPLQLPGAEHRLLFKAGLETFVLGYDAINTGDFVSASGGYLPVSDGFSAEQRKFYIDVFQLILNYNIRFSPQWFYETELIFKFKGTPILDGSAKKVVAAHDTAEAFKQNFHIVFANMIGYNHSSGLNLYAKIEYEIRDILKENASGQKLKTIHDLQFKGGVSYSFDFSRLNAN